MSLLPNIVIFRLPLEVGAEFEFDEAYGKTPPAFVQLQIVDGQLDPQSSMIFTVHESDSYSKLKTDQLMFAYFENDKSTEICSFSIASDEGEPANILEVGIAALNQMLPQFLHEIEHILAERAAKQVTN